jgi:hypothetical protein
MIVAWVVLGVVLWPAIGFAAWCCLAYPDDFRSEEGRSALPFAVVLGPVSWVLILAIFIRDSIHFGRKKGPDARA